MPAPPNIYLWMTGCFRSVGHIRILQKTILDQPEPLALSFLITRLPAGPKLRVPDPLETGKQREPLFFAALYKIFLNSG